MVGLFVGALRVAPVRWIQRVGGLYVEFFRNIPLLVLLSSPTWDCSEPGSRSRPGSPGPRASGLYTAAYVAETIRSGVFAVGKGQIEAGLSLGFTVPAGAPQIVLPQAIRSVIPRSGAS